MRKPVRITLFITVSLVLILAIIYSILKMIAFQKAISNIENYITQELSKRKRTVEWVNNPD